MDDLEKAIANSPPCKYSDCFGRARPDGLVMEFGVAGGRTLALLAQCTDKDVWGFDSFQGLPEDWRRADGSIYHEKGHFNGRRPETLSPNSHLIEGLFQDTLVPFLDRFPGVPISLIHIDSDLYSSAKYILNTLKDRLDGVVVIFDEVYGDSQSNFHEGKAFREFLQETQYKYECIGKIHRNAAAFVLHKD